MKKYLAEKGYILVSVDESGLFKCVSFYADIIFFHGIEYI